MTARASDKTWASYHEACMSYAGAVAQTEEALREYGDGQVNLRDLTTKLSGRGVTYDQVSRILRAIQETGAIRSVGDGAYVRDVAADAECRSERLAVLRALRWAAEASGQLGGCELLLAMPADGSREVGDTFDSQFFDLRTTIRSLIAEASDRIVLAAPYWDEHVANELVELLRRRVQAGVSIALLARRPPVGSMNEKALGALRAGLEGFQNAEVRIFERPSSVDPFGSSTFHFKVACADARRAYLGSANFNTAGLNSRWELGVLVEGSAAQTIARLVESLWAASSTR